MAFQIGDKVRFTDACPRNWWFGPTKHYKEGVVKTIRRPGGMYQYTIEVQGHANWDAAANDEHIELIEAVQPIAQPPAQPSVTFYTLVYKTRGSASRKIAGFEGEGQFEEKKSAVLRQGGTIISSKKIKLTNV